MDFLEVIEQARAVLRSKGRVTYRTLKRQFALDDEALEDLKEELVFADPQITDEDGRGLVWTGPKEEAEKPGIGDSETSSQSPASYEWFTERFETRDLKDAKALLDELETS